MFTRPKVIDSMRRLDKSAINTQLVSKEKEKSCLSARNSDKRRVLLFAYSRRVFSGRKIELMLEENVPMMVQQRSKKFHIILSITLGLVNMPMNWLRRAFYTLPIY